MKIALIIPCNDTNEWKGKRSVFVFPSYSIACLASVTPPEHTLFFYDETIEDIPLNEDFDLVGISILTSTATRGYEIAQHFKDRNIPVVLGGVHASLCPNEAKQHADAVAIGEGEITWPQIINDVYNHSLKKEYKSSFVPLSSVPKPDQSIFKGKKYGIQNVVMTTRGCPYQCSFCSTAPLFGPKIRTRSIEDIVEEIKNFKKRFFIFLDDNLFFSKNYAKRLLKAIIPLKKRWVAQATYNIADDEELLQLARKAGCMAVLIGFESVSEINFKEMGKPVKSIVDYKDAIKRIHDAGILIQGSFIFGFDGDTIDIFKDTLDFVKEIGIDTANFCTLTPTPGTKLFEKYDETNRIITYDWSQYTRQKVVFKPLNYTAEQLAEKRLWTYRKMYSWTSMFRRVPFKYPHFFWFWIYNLTFRRGIKQSVKNAAESIVRNSNTNIVELTKSGKKC